MKFIDPEDNKNAYKNSTYNNAVVRVLIRVKTPLTLQVFAPGNHEKPLALDYSMSTWDHLCLFETQLVAPDFLKTSYRLESYMDWIGKFRWGKWQLADLDNWMEGNRLVFGGKADRMAEGHKDEIFKGTKFDRSVHVDVKHL